MSIDAIILAGGLGTRLKEVVSDRPKPLALINGKPFLDLLLEKLASCREIKSTIIAVSHLGDQIITRYSSNDTYPFEIQFSKEPHPLGTGGAIQQAMNMATSRQCLVLNGDSYFDLDLDKFINFHYKKNGIASMALVHMNDTQRFGLVIADPNSDRITGFQEKSKFPSSGFINSGVYLIDKNKVFFPDNKISFSFEMEVIPNWIEKDLYGFASKGRFIDIGTKESYENSQNFFLEKVETDE